MNGLLSAADFEFYDQILAFLEGVYGAAGEYREGELDEETARDVLLLNFTKVVNDCRAILALAGDGFYIQAAIVLRSTLDACNVMMHIAFEGKESGVAERWLGGERLKHWDVVGELNRVLGDEGQLNLRRYGQTRQRLDDIVHANFPGLTMYPAQAPGPTPLSAEVLARATFWTPLLDLCVVSSLLTVDLVTHEGTEEAGAYLQAVLARTGTA